MCSRLQGDHISRGRWGRLCPRLYHLVSDAADGFDDIGQIAQLFTDMADMYVHRPGFSNKLKPPDVVKKIIAGQDLTDILCKRSQEFKFLEREGYLLTVQKDLVVLRINRQTAIVDYAGR